MIAAPRYWHFNSHPHEEDDQSCCRVTDLDIYFNSHPHEEDDLVCAFLFPGYRISTHILTRRMTVERVVVMTEE